MYLRVSTLEIPDDRLEQGTLNLITGPNGSGKSLFAALLLHGDLLSKRKQAALTTKIRGSIRLERQPSTRTAADTTDLRVGVIPQHIHRISHTVDEYISRFCSTNTDWKCLFASLNQCIQAESFGGKKLLYVCKYALSLYVVGCNVIIFDEPDTALDEPSIGVVRSVTDFLIRQHVLVAVITHAPGLYSCPSRRIVFGAT
jgi:energy-coupling factor transporter ATP-binding protein EcfA2